MVSLSTLGFKNRALAWGGGKSVSSVYKRSAEGIDICSRICMPTFSTILLQRRVHNGAFALYHGYGARIFGGLYFYQTKINQLDAVIWRQLDI